MSYLQPFNPGDIKKFVVKINGEDVTDAVISADVYMDIFTPVWTAHVFFDDAVNLLSRLPIKAGSTITIQVETDFDGMTGDGEKTYEMIIYRIGDKNRVNHAQQQYTVFAADPLLFRSQKTRIKRSFKDMKANQIARDIVSEGLGAGLESDSSDENISVVIPNWSPINAASWLSKVALTGGAADFCFFQKDAGHMAFKSFEKMYSDSSGPTFVQRPAGVKASGDYNTDFTVEVARYHWEHFDGARGMAAGLYSSKTVSFDLVNKRWEEKSFRFGDDCAADRAGRNFEGDLEGEESNVSFTPKHEGMYDDVASHLDSATDWIPSRKSSVQKMDMEKLVIQIPGSAGSWRWLGAGCRVDLPAEDDMSDEKFDPYRRGKYVAVALCQNIRKDAYSTNIELVKKRLE